MIRLLKSLPGLLLLLGLLAGGVAGCENQAWQRARDQNTPEAYQEYLSKYPGGKHAPTALEQVDRMSYGAALAERTLAGYRRYLERFPEGAYAKNAQEQISTLVKSRVAQLPLDRIAAARVKVQTTLGSFTIGLFPDRAPNHCRNFLTLVLTDFYNGLTVHRVEKDRLIQMGDPRGDSLGGPGYMIPAEINDLKHRRGIVSMWRLPVDPDTAGSQFMICVQDQPQLDGLYTVFGQVVEGMETVDRISEVETTGRDRYPWFQPIAPVTIEQATVEGLSIEE